MTGFDLRVQQIGDEYRYTMTFCIGADSYECTGVRESPTQCWASAMALLRWAWLRGGA